MLWDHCRLSSPSSVNGSEYCTLVSLTDERACRPESLSPKVVELTALAASSRSGCGILPVKVHFRATAREGATRDEIFDSLMIIGPIGRTRVFAPALRELQEIFMMTDGNRRVCHDNQVLIHARRTCDGSKDSPRGCAASSHLLHLQSDLETGTIRLSRSVNLPIYQEPFHEYHLSS
jgi:AhpD family alkylhydroperoxidase